MARQCVVTEKSRTKHHAFIDTNTIIINVYVQGEQRARRQRRVHAKMAAAIVHSKNRRISGIRPVRANCTVN